MSQQIAVVTGASGGFGAAITLALLDVGYAVAAADIDVAALQRLEEEIGKPGRLGVFAMDVTDHGSVEQASGAIAEKMGLPVTVLVNNAGILDRTYCVNDRSQTQSRKVIDVNLTGAFNCTGVFTRSMVRQRYGRVINIASIAGIWGAGGRGGLCRLQGRSHQGFGILGAGTRTVQHQRHGDCAGNLQDQYVQTLRTGRHQRHGGR
ncbi:putative 3-oxoacyl-(acyl-carrier-protein) reductase [Agrobacterium tomkonis CFBP 6623]|uniref:Putative 3-oxoacyl-(Acyl-carrier-protein) reductase n=1 Tax=Agrobacterium tomkonis CFBP 6623 TaxID=1183432 RepID=A0A1S7PG19_9HYPH|nr:putative 3-oxoacyl-(acyl-carrier-protein) reductase [Agrobacterium tomkonis CFBP 6623]